MESLPQIHQKFGEACVGQEVREHTAASTAAMAARASTGAQRRALGGAAAASAGARGPAAARVFRTKEKRVTTQKNPAFFAANTGTSPWKGIIQGKNDPIPEPEPEFSDDLFPEGALETLQDVAIMMIHHGQEKLLSAEMFTNFVMTKYFAFLPGLGVASRPAAASLAGTTLAAMYYHLVSTGTEGFP